MCRYISFECPSKKLLFDRQALLSAWKEACNSPTPNTIVVPKGTFGLIKATLGGPCKAPIELQVQGILRAPQNPSLIKEGEWVTIQHLDHFTLSGGGTFDGQGARAWSQNDCAKTGECSKLPNVSFFSVKYKCFEVIN